MRRVLLAAVATYGLVVSSCEPTLAAPALLLFGDNDRKTFLGCINCSKYDSSSVCNEYGEFGSKYQINSIWDEYGTYGSRYNTYSPWNPYASATVAIVDGDGNFYGYFTANRYAPNRTNIPVLNQLSELAAEGKDLDSLRKGFCQAF